MKFGFLDFCIQKSQNWSKIRIRFLPMASRCRFTLVKNLSCNQRCRRCHCSCSILICSGVKRLSSLGKAIAGRELLAAFTFNCFALTPTSSVSFFKGKDRCQIGRHSCDLRNQNGCIFFICFCSCPNVHFLRFCLNIAEQMVICTGKIISRHHGTIQYPSKLISIEMAYAYTFGRHWHVVS